MSPPTLSEASTSNAVPQGLSGRVSVHVNTDKVQINDESIISNYQYENAHVEKRGDDYYVTPTTVNYQFKVDKKVPKLGLMLVGLGGNNGSTLTAAILANKHGISFHNKKGLVEPNYYGSVTQSSTIKLGIDPATGKDVYAPFNEIVPMVHPNDIVVSGWDISGANLSDAMVRAQVLDYDLQRQLKKHLSSYSPLPSIYYPDFIAANQKDRADNLIPGDDKWEHVQKIRTDIQEFKEKNSLDKVVVLWTANTERYADIIEGVNDTADNLLAAVKASHEEVAPSTVFAIASILEGVPFINGSPQNTFVPGCIELAERHKSFIGGDDFKSGQTKIKSVLAQYLVDAGIKPLSIASYNHLGNNDGYNLSAPKQFKSKEISKASVVDDMIESNHLLYNEKSGNKVDHCIVIKYVPAVGDDKVAMDEYHSELMLGGHNTVSIHNVCEDSLLATPLIIDLVVVAEFLSRVSYKEADADEDYQKLHSVMSFLSYWLKAPLTRPGADAVNGLNKQRAALENLLRGLVGLGPLNELKFEERLW